MVESFKNLDLLSVGIVVAATGVLGFITLVNNQKSISNKLFATFTGITILWSVCNYLSYQFHDGDIALWLLRLEIFFAVWLVYFLLVFLSVFPKEDQKLPDHFKLLAIPASLVSILNLTPLVFVNIAEFSVEGRVSKVTNGPGIVIFGAYVFAMVIPALIVLFRKTFHSTGIERKQLQSILVGISIMFVLLITFNFIFPAFLNNARYIALGGLFIFPFILSTSYAFVRHGLFHTKILATEMLTVTLAVAMLLEVIFSNDIVTLIFRVSVFLLVLGVGFLLIKSVRTEVRQREELEILTKRLEVANEKLKVLDQARAEFISIASHQLRTPPATVKWYLSAIINGDYGKVTPSVKEMLVKTERTNNLLISLIEDILNVSRIERGKMEFLFAKTDVLDLAKITYEQLQPLASEKKQNLTFVTPKTKIPSIMADKEKLRQVMNNMIDNAIKYTPSGGTITVSLVRIKDELKFQVQDTGKGISKEDANNIFQKFSRGKESIKQSAGLGLGLYVAKVIVEQHKGRLWAESDGIGKGSRFIFSLPIKNGLAETTLFDLTKAQTSEPIKNSQTA